MKLQELPRCNLPRHWYVRLELSFAPRNVHAHITEGACTPCIVGVCVFDCPVFLFSIARLQVIKLNLLPLYYFCMQATNGNTCYCCSHLRTHKYCCMRVWIFRAKCTYKRPKICNNLTSTNFVSYSTVRHVRLCVSQTRNIKVQFTGTNTLQLTANRTHMCTDIYECVWLSM